MTGKFYASEANANAANPASGTATTPRVVTYKAAAVYYYAWLNPNTLDPTTWTISPARRNNIYNVNISKFRNIGLSGNPFVPTDPQNPNNPDTTNNPDTPDPEDPDTPNPEEPLPVQKTYMVVEVTVTPWTLHTYDIEF